MTISSVPDGLKRFSCVKKIWENSGKGQEAGSGTRYDARPVKRTFLFLKILWRFVYRNRIYFAFRRRSVPLRRLLCIPARGTAERVFDGYCTGVDSYVMDGETIWQASVSFAGGSMNTDFIRLDCSGREPSAGYLGTFEGSFEFGEGGVFGGKYFSPRQNFALDLETCERISILNGKPMTD